jgi:electron transfer flavoprotein beta subunit
MLAALLDYGQALFASRIEFKDGAVEVTREVDGGLQVLSLDLPAIITTDLRLNEPRFATLPNIMKAKSKPVDRRSADSFGIDIGPRQTVVSTLPPPTRKAGIKVASAAELVDRLRNDARVI